MRLQIKGKVRAGAPFEILFKDQVIPVKREYGLEPYPNQTSLAWTWLDGSRFFVVHPGLHDCPEWHVVIDGQKICTRHIVYYSLVDQILKRSMLSIEWEFSDGSKYMQHSFCLQTTIYDELQRRHVFWRRGLFNSKTDVLFGGRPGLKSIAIFVGMVLAHIYDSDDDA